MSAKPSDIQPNDLRTAEEVAAILKVDPKTVFNWAKNGIIPEAFRVGRTVRFSLQAVKASFNVNSVGDGRKVETKKKNGRVCGIALSEAFNCDSGWWQTSQSSAAEK